MQKRVLNRPAHGQQAVVAQNQVIGFAQIGLQTRLLGSVEGDAFVVVVGQRRQNEGGLLAERQQTALLCADGDAGARVRVQHTTRIFTHLMHAAVNRETSRVYGKGRFAQFVATLVDFDQAGRGDFIKHQAIRVDQKVMFWPRNARADVGEHQVAPAVGGDQAVTGGQVNAELPFFRADFVFQGGDVQHRYFLDGLNNKKYLPNTRQVFDLIHNFKKSGRLFVQSRFVNRVLGRGHQSAQHRLESADR